MAKEKTVGRAKAIENSFIKRGTQPEDYSPVTKLQHKSKNCELCGQHIDYDFLLQHKADTDKNMYVGSDCIITFAKAHMPNIAEQILQYMELEMQKQIDEEKAKFFNEEHPNFKEDVRQLTTSIKEILYKHNVSRDFMYGKLFLDIFETIASVTTDYNKKKYTTGPKTDAIYKFKKEIENGSFEEKISEYSKLKQNPMTVAQELKKLGSAKADVSEFYSNYYFKNVKYLKWAPSASEDSPALSKMEKEIFLQSLESYIGKRTRLKKKMKKNKNEILTKLEKNLLDQVRYHSLDENGNRERLFSWYSSQEDQAKLNEFKFYFSFYFLNVYSLKQLTQEYGLMEISELIDKIRQQDFLYSIGGQDHGSMLKNYVIFKNESSAQEFISNIKSHFLSKIKNFEDFLESEELSNEKFF